MNPSKLRRAAGIFVFLIVSLPALRAQDAPIQSFGNDFAVRFSLKYNFLSFTEHREPEDEYTSNRPIDIGIGATYKRISLGFSISIPFLYNHEFSKTDSFDFSVSYFGNILAVEAFCRKYEGFHLEEGTANIDETDLALFSAGVSGMYIFNNEVHSLRAAYTLNRMQTVSSGGALLGFGMFYTSIHSEDGLIGRYSEKMHYIHFGPNAGYSYTWIFKNNFFININAVIGINAGVCVTNGEWFFSPQVLPKFSAGHHGGTWSVNVAFTGNFLGIIRDSSVSDSILSGKTSITFSKRF
ncbi:DUF4421 family protein [Breznakiella homolactica]|uniref:DUF4421 family protein n=1 Tax=Breznakiella homolactica TaxID=2798577 RepID=A0A7T7XP91_9SPIR|nr:DUF4421 family protein [Breznakiella homolactica]QQO10004.1 DUF4421 domain-containing protein [Breznakiella homolactica]